MNVGFFSTLFLKRISYTCNSNHRVYDGSVHTLTCCTHIFLRTGRTLRTSAHFSCVSHTHGSSSWKKCVSHECLCSLSRLLPSHVSPVCAVLVRLPWHHLSVLFLAVRSRPESAGHAPLRTCIAIFGYLAKSDAHTQKHDFAKPVASRVSRILGTVRRFRIAQIPPQMCHSSRASLPRLAVAVCAFSGVACARHKDFTLRERNKDVELDASMNAILFSHYNECPLLYNFFVSIWRQASVLPPRGHLFHDLITQLFPRSLQYGMAVMGVIDAFVHAHNPYRRNMDNPGNFGDGMKGRIRFLTAITPAYAHAWQLICLAGHIPFALHSKFRLPAAKARDPYLPNARTTTLGHLHWRVYSRGWWWNLSQMGCRHTISPRKNLCHVCLSHHDRSASCVRRCQGPFKLFCWDVSHYRSAFFSRAMAQLPVMRALVFFFLIPSMPLVFVWARSMLARTYSLDSPANSYCWKSSAGYDLPFNTSTVMRRTLETNARIMPPHWVHLASCRTITFHTLGVSFIWFQFVLCYLSQPWWFPGRVTWH